MLHSVSQWVLPDDVIEDTAHPNLTPWRCSPIKTDISQLPKPEAAIEHTSLIRDLCADTNNIIAYSDGSQLEGQMGAGYCITDGLPRQVNEPILMGDTTEVFDAELHAIHDCLATCQKIIEYNRLHRRRIHIFSDNQAAILRASLTTYGPGQELARSIHTIATSLRSRRTSVILHWVLGHTAIPGNDHADLLTKTATTLTPTSPPPVSLSWIRRQIHEQYIQDWVTWYCSMTKPKTYDAPHPRRLDHAYTALPRKISTAILGLRTGHGYFLDCLANPPTAQYPSRSCSCPLHPPETPKHLILSCPHFTTQYTKLRRMLKLPRHRQLTLPTILHTTAGTKALSAMISETKIATAKWVHARLRRLPAEEDTPITLTTDWRTLLDLTDEHASTPEN
jgi:ribonuclease HI